MSEDNKKFEPTPYIPITRPADVISYVEVAPKLGDRKVIGDIVVEFDGAYWREPASGRLVA